MDVELVDNSPESPQIKITVPAEWISTKRVEIEGLWLNIPGVPSFYMNDWASYMDDLDTSAPVVITLTHDTSLRMLDIMAALIRRL